VPCCFTRPLSEPARLQLPLLDPQVARNLGIVAANLFDEPVGVLAADERLDRVPERKSGERASSTTA
jgi:hypothetical protein